MQNGEFFKIAKNRKIDPVYIYSLNSQHFEGRLSIFMTKENQPITRQISLFSLFYSHVLCVFTRLPCVYQSFSLVYHSFALVYPFRTYTKIHAVVDIC